MPEHLASCCCGQLRLTAEGDPVRVSICHCLACQQRTGSVFGYQARFPDDRVQIRGQARDYTRLADDDGEPRTFSFCPECGSTVYYRCASEPELVAVAVGMFGDPSFAPPQRSVYESRRHAWIGLPSDMERHD
jgi:hypothetical protein